MRLLLVLSVLLASALGQQDSACFVDQTASGVTSVDLQGGLSASAWQLCVNDLVLVLNPDVVQAQTPDLPIDGLLSLLDASIAYRHAANTQLCSSAAFATMTASVVDVTAPFWMDAENQNVGALADKIYTYFQREGLQGCQVVYLRDFFFTPQPRCTGTACQPQPYDDSATPAYMPQLARYPVAGQPSSTGECAGDGECQKAGCGNQCAQYQDPLGAGTCEYNGGLVEAYCGCVSTHCVWFTQSPFPHAMYIIPSIIGAVCLGALITCVVCIRRRRARASGSRDPPRVDTRPEMGPAIALA